MDGFSARFDTYVTVFYDLHDSGDFAVDSDGLTLFPEDSGTLQDCPEDPGTL